MQASWRDDPTKCTFIVLDATQCGDRAAIDSATLDGKLLARDCA